MFLFLIIVHIFVSIVLISVILMQAGRGGGVSEIFGGSSTQTIFGTSATKFLQRATAAVAIIFIITSLSLAILSSRRSRSLMESRGAGLMDVKEATTIPVGEIEVVPIEDAEEPVEP